MQKPQIDAEFLAHALLLSAAIFVFAMGPAAELDAGLGLCQRAEVVPLRYVA